VSGARILPAETELTAPFWAAARQGAVALQRCTDCGHTWHPPAPVCPQCRSGAYTWFRSSGTGKLYSYTQVAHAAHPAVTGALPYLVALVDLAEGPRLICGLTDITDETELAAGLPVTIVLGLAAGGLDLLVARPAAGFRGAAGRDRPA
jgi:uncharacterized OB-fold protein